MAEQLSHSTDRQKGRSQNFALLAFSIMRRLTVIQHWRWSSAFPKWPSASFRRQRRKQRRRSRKSLKIFDMSVFHAILTCVALSACLAYGCLVCRVSTLGLGAVLGAHGTSESP